MPPFRSPPPPVVGLAGVAGRMGESGPGVLSVGPNGVVASKPPSSQVMKMAECLVHALLWVMSPTQVRRKVSPSLYSACWLASFGALGNGQPVAPPCMSLQLFGVIQTNFGTLPVDRSVLSCVSGTTLPARAGFW